MSPMLTATPGQTIGPFFGYALPFDRGNELVPPGSPGAIQLHGVVTDGHGKPVPDALLEIWQADADGVIPKATGSLRRNGWTFTGWGRASTDGEGRYIFRRCFPVRRNRIRLLSSCSPSSPAACSTGCSPARICLANSYRATPC